MNTARRAKLRLEELKQMIVVSMSQMKKIEIDRNEPLVKRMIDRLSSKN